MPAVFLTGGRGDIGAAIYKKFIQSGYDVIAPTSDELNLADSKAIESFFSNEAQIYDVLIHCAGVNNPKPFLELSEHDMLHTASVNSLSFFHLVQKIAPTMIKKKKGHILAISSLYGSIARKGRLAYVASKHALNGSVKTLACELAESNILVNTLSPGFVDTALTRKNNSCSRIHDIEAKIPTKRMAKPEEIANTAYFLCSKENTYITGQDIIVDGGFMAAGGQE